jgi:Zn-dependent protease with chaperone function
MSLPSAFHSAPAGRRWRCLIPVLALCAAFGAAAPSQAEDIQSVLDRSTRSKLAYLQDHAVRDARAERLQHDFDRLLARMSPRPEVTLLVVDGPAQAETLAGAVVVISASFAALEEGERLFILSHELGHALMGHWNELSAVYRRHIPGEVTQVVTDAVAPALGREASTLVHSHEYAADAYAWQTLRSLGHGLGSVQAALHVVPNMGDTPTHPSSRKRFARLRTIGEGEVRSAGLAAD